MTDTSHVKTEEEMTEDERTALAASEDFIVNFTDEDYADPEKVEELKQALAAAKTTVHQKRHFREKVTDLETKLNEKDGTTPPKKEETPAPAAQPSTEMIEFRQDHPGLTRAAVQEVFDYAKVKNITPEAALETPVIKAALKAMDTKEDVEDASVTPTAPSATGIEKRDWSRATPQEIAAHRATIERGG